MANNLFLIRLKVDKFASNALGMRPLEQLRRLVPPQTTFIVYIETTVDSEYIEITSPGTATAPGAEELFTSYEGPAPFEDSAVPYLYAGSDEGWVKDLALIIREVTGQC